MLIDHNTFQLLKRSIQSAGWLELPAIGNSMYPLIQQGEICRFNPIEAFSIKKGDILLFYTEKGQLIAHRLYRMERMYNQQFYLLKGDTNLGFDAPIQGDRIIGKLVCVQKKNKVIRPESLLPFFWGKVIQSFPLLSGILRKYLNRNVHLQY
jgi:signal peptidase I